MGHVEPSSSPSANTCPPGGIRTDQIVAVAEWLVVQILSSKDAQVNAAAKLLYRHILSCERAEGHANAARQLILTLADDDSVVLCGGHQDHAAITAWLGVQVLRLPEGPEANAGRILFRSCLDAQQLEFTLRSGELGQFPRVDRSGEPSGSAHDAVAVAEWLAAEILSPGDNLTSNMRRSDWLGAAKVAFHYLMSDVAERLPAGEEVTLRFARERSGRLRSAHPNLVSLADFLSERILVSNELPFVNALKMLFESLIGRVGDLVRHHGEAVWVRAAGLNTDKLTDLHERLQKEESLSGRRQAYYARAQAANCAVENALVWMVLHSRPPGGFALQRRRLPAMGLDRRAATDWATAILDRKVIRPMFRDGKWLARCRRAKDAFGYRLTPYLYEVAEKRRSAFSLEDDCVNHIWERINDYRGPDFQDFLDKELEDYWKTVRLQFRQSEEVSAAQVDGRVRHPPTDPDLAILRGWPPIDGLLAACMLDFWKELPATLLDTWLRRLNVARRDLEFGLAKFKPLECRPLLSSLTNTRRNTLDRRWQRLWPKLSRLQFLQSRLMSS
jgi:hypothetical protein